MGQGCDPADPGCRPPCVVTVDRPGGTFGDLQGAVDAAADGATIDVRGLCAGPTLVLGRANLTIQGVPPASGLCPPGPRDLLAILQGGDAARPESNGEVVKVVKSTNIVVRYLNIVDGASHDGLEFKRSWGGGAHCNCVADNDEGYQLHDGGGHVLSDSLVVRNDQGIVLHLGPVDSVVRGNVVEANAHHGIALLDSATERNRVVGNRVRANGGDCINVDEADVNVVSANVAGGDATRPDLDCGGVPVRVQNDADGNRFDDNRDGGGVLLSIACNGGTSEGNSGDNCRP
jgi:hypothetical protein